MTLITGKRTFNYKVKKSKRKQPLSARWYSSLVACSSNSWPSSLAASIRLLLTSSTSSRPLPMASPTHETHRDGLSLPSAAPTHHRETMPTAAHPFQRCHLTRPATLAPSKAFLSSLLVHTRTSICLASCLPSTWSLSSSLPWLSSPVYLPSVAVLEDTSLLWWPLSLYSSRRSLQLSWLHG